MRPLLIAGKSDKWTVVDLRTIKKEWTNKRIAVPEEIKKLIISYDIILIPPAIRDCTPNYEAHSGS
jgi:hypothetical protein